MGRRAGKDETSRQRLERISRGAAACGRTDQEDVAWLVVLAGREVERMEDEHPRPGSIKGAHARIDELEEAAKQFTEQQQGLAAEDTRLHERLDDLRIGLIDSLEKRVSAHATSIANLMDTTRIQQRRVEEIGGWTGTMQSVHDQLASQVDELKEGVKALAARLSYQKAPVVIEREHMKAFEAKFRERTEKLENVAHITSIDVGALSARIDALGGDTFDGASQRLDRLEHQFKSWEESLGELDRLSGKEAIRLDQVFSKVSSLKANQDSTLKHQNATDRLQAEHEHRLNGIAKERVKCWTANGEELVAIKVRLCHLENSLSHHANRIESFVTVAIDARDHAASIDLKYAELSAEREGYDAEIEQLNERLTESQAVTARMATRAADSLAQLLQRSVRDGSNDG